MVASFGIQSTFLLSEAQSAGAAGSAIDRMFLIELLLLLLSGRKRASWRRHDQLIRYSDIVFSQLS